MLLSKRQRAVDDAIERSGVMRATCRRRRNILPAYRIVRLTCNHLQNSRIPSGNLHGQRLQHALTVATIDSTRRDSIALRCSSEEMFFAIALKSKRMQFLAPDCK